MTASTEHVLSVLVENKFGVLARVAGLFSARGFNIRSLTVAPTLDPQYSRMTIVTAGDEHVMEQIYKQLNKLINVIKVVDYADIKFVDREMMLIKVTAETEYRAEIMRISDIFRAKVVDVGTRSYTLEVTGDEGRLAAVVEILKPFGIKEIARTGKVAMSRELQNANGH